MRAKEALAWIEAVVGQPLKPAADDVEDQTDVKTCLKDGQMLCRLIREISSTVLQM